MSFAAWIPQAHSLRAGLAGLPVNLTHDDVDAADDGGNIGDEAALADGVGDAEIGKARRLGADAERYGILGRPADDVEAHLTAWAFRFHVGLTAGKVPWRLDAVTEAAAECLLQLLLFFLLVVG